MVENEHPPVRTLTMDTAFCSFCSLTKHNFVLRPVQTDVLTYHNMHNIVACFGGFLANNVASVFMVLKD